MAERDPDLHLRHDADVVAILEQPRQEVRADFDADAAARGNRDLAADGGEDRHDHRAGGDLDAVARPDAVEPSGGRGAAGPRLGARDGGEERQRQGRDVNQCCRTACSGPPV